MFFNIVKKEILLNLVSFRFAVSVILLFFLIVGSLQLMAVNYSRRMVDYESSRETHIEDLRKTTTLMQFIAFGLSRDPRPPLLGIFSLGLEQKMSSSFRIPGYNIEEFQGIQSPVHYQRYSELEGMEMEGSKYANPIFTLFQPPDFIYVVNIVLSLFAILFAFDCISGEKEDQTLKLMLSNSVPRDIVLFAKWIGGTVSIMVPFAVSFLLGILLVSLRPNIAFTGEALPRIALIFCTSALFVAVFYLIGMVCSTFTERPATSLIVALFAWVVFVLVIPNIAPVVARQIKPISTPDQITANEELKNRELAKKVEAEENKTEEFRQSARDDLKSYVSSLETEWQNRLENQTKLAMNLSRVSPSANFMYAASGLAGTGVYDFNNFRAQVLKYKETSKYDNKDKDKRLWDQDPSKPFPPDTFVKMDVEKVQPFEVKSLTLAESLNKAIIDIGILAVYGILLFMASFIGFLRYDVK